MVFFCDECPWDVKTAEYDEAIKTIKSVLSKQSASSVQADKSLIVDFVAFQKEWLNSHKTLELDAVNNALVNIFLGTTGKAFIDALNQTAENDEDRIAIDLKKRTITERLIIAESLINSVIADSDQFRDSAKKTDSEMNCDEWWKNYIRSRMSRDDVPGTNVGKTDFKPDLLEKLTRYEPGGNPGIIHCKDCKHAKVVFDAIWCDKDGGYYYPVHHFCGEVERRNNG